MTTSSATPLFGVDARTVTRPLDALLRQVAERFPLLACATPINATAEQARLLAAWTSGDEATPTWEAPRIDRPSLATLRRAFDQARVALEDVRDPWLAAYRARVIEHDRELALVDASFGPNVSEAARARFATGDREREADALAARLLDAPIEEGGSRIATDDERDPRSLVSRMRAAISARGLGVRVVLRERIGALAAAGDGIVIVASHRRTTEREAERVVLHEVEGHVLPRERGRSFEHGLGTLGSAGASEDEEGRAIVLEERAGLLDARRGRALAARHVAARLVDHGATYVDVVRHLRDEAHVSIEDALSTTSRVMRGAYARGRDVVGGVARERVYLSSFLRISAAVRADESLLERLGRARLSWATRRDLGL
jgi:hypothetical protein